MPFGIWLQGNSPAVATPRRASITASDAVGMTRIFGINAAGGPEVQHLGGVAAPKPQISPFSADKTAGFVPCTPGDIEPAPDRGGLEDVTLR